MRITADFIDEEPTAEGGSEGAGKPEKRLRIVLRGPPKNESTEQLIETMLKQFQNLSIKFSSAFTNSKPGTPEAEKRDQQREMEASNKKTSAEAPEAKSSCCVEYVAKIKEEIKQEVIEEVLKVLNEKNQFTPPAMSIHRSERDEASATTAKVADKSLHSGIFCDHCDLQIRGVRYKCVNCPDFNLCEECEKIPEIHDHTHVFLKLRYPFSLLMNMQSKVNNDVVNKGSNGCQIKPVCPSYNVEPEEKKSTEKTSLMSAKFVCDETAPDGTVFTPGTKFVKSWRVINTGTKPWTKCTVIRQIWGSHEMKPYLNVVAVPLLECGEEGVVSVYFSAPSNVGEYESYWEFRHLSEPFGDTLWCRIRVVSLEHISSFDMYIPSQKVPIRKSFYCEPMFSLSKNRRKVRDEKRKRKECRQRDVKQIVDVLTAVQEENGCRRSSLGSLKPVVTSHTATPNNTPFDLTPPKSPEPNELIEIKASTSVNVAANLTEVPAEEASENANYGPENEDKVSITAVSSSESDSEFVVIPMPKCFSLLESYTQAPTSENVGFGATLQNPLTQEVSKSNLQKTGNSENVSQETGAPEEAENFNINTTIHVKEDCGRKVIISDVSLSCSPSSSSVSIIETEDSSSPVESPQNSAQSHPMAKQVVVKGLVSLGQAPSNSLEQSMEMPSTCTFPKFPLEAEPEQVLKLNEPEQAANQAEPAQVPNQAESEQFSKPAELVNERTIQVLPEGLVTGALIAAASVYNTARAVISSIQPGKSDQAENGQHASLNSVTWSDEEWLQLTPAQQLVEMGFSNTSLNEQLLKEKNNDVAAVIGELVNMNDSDWYASRQSS